MDKLRLPFIFPGEDEITVEFCESGSPSLSREDYGSDIRDFVTLIRKRFHGYAYEELIMVLLSHHDDNFVDKLRSEFKNREHRVKISSINKSIETLTNNSLRMLKDYIVHLARKENR